MVFGLAYQLPTLPLFGYYPFDTRRYFTTCQTLLDRGVVTPDQIYVPQPVDRATLRRVHDAEYLDDLEDPARVAEFFEAPALADLPRATVVAIVDAFRHATGGTLLAAREALRWGFAVNLAGGYHHAKPRHGEGFCLFADIPLSIAELRAEGRIHRALVIDLDVHQGNGTVVCLWGDRETFTFSMHQEHIYPEPKEDSDLDVDLPAGTDDATYLALLDRYLPEVFERAQADLVYYVAGCDVLDADPLASLALTETGVIERDRRVVMACRDRGLPVVMTLAGGYSPQAGRLQGDSIVALLQALAS